MYIKRVINDIEKYYSRYCESISDQMLYYSTMHFVSYLYSYSIVKDILLNLKKECPYNKETIEEYNKLEKELNNIKNIKSNINIFLNIFNNKP